MALIKKAPLIGYELYNLDDDPAERRDLSATQPAKLAELTAAVQRIHDEVRTEGPVWPPFSDPGYEQKVIEWPNYAAKPLPKQN